MAHNIYTILYYFVCTAGGLFDYLQLYIYAFWHHFLKPYFVYASQLSAFRRLKFEKFSSHVMGLMFPLRCFCH